jgi:NADH-quinone oxidoreductase subunit M
METALLGVFTTRDALVFYIFWELALIPAWFICALWGSGDRIRVTFKFFAYTFTGSLLMLVALVFIYLKTPIPHSFDFGRMYEAILTPGERNWIFIALFLAMAVKIPVFPFHTWQPDTYTAAPAAGSMLLGGIMLKMGLYGVIRLVIPFAGEALANWGDPAIILAITGIVYASLIAMTRDDLKRLLAYSSIAHVGLITAGLITASDLVLGGGIIQMVAHGINLTGLFILTDYIERRTGTRNISALGGIALRAPRMAVLFMILLLGSIALPLTDGFPGEFILLTGLFWHHKVYAAVAGLTVILSAVYMLWMYQRVFLGTTNTLTDGITDLTFTEMISVVPLAVMVLVIGWYPNLILQIIAQN